MKRPVRAVAALLAAAFALAGCGGTTAGAQLVMARVKDAVFLDPSHAIDGLSHLVTAEAMEGVVEFKQGSFDVGPGLATAWSTSSDGKRWTFTLRPNAKFTDGTPANAASVKFNFDRWRLKNSPDHGNFSYAYWVSQFGGYSDDPKAPGVMRDVIVNSPTSVTFVLAQPSGTFLRNMAMFPFYIGSPTAIKADPKAFEQKPVGSGPYAVQEWVKDDHITLTANPDYNGPLAKPTIPTVIVRDIPDQATSVLSIQKGDIDILTDPRPDDAKSLASQSSLKIEQQPPNNVAYLALNLDKKPFDNVLVRRAIAQAIDIPAIIKALYGPGTVPANNFTPPGMLGENTAVTIYAHNVAAAKALLAKAGFPNGFSTNLYVPTAPRPYMPEPTRLAEAIQADLKAIGVNATLQPQEFGVFLNTVRNGMHDMCLIGWSGDNGDPDNYYYTLLDQDSAHKGDAQNYSFWRDPAFHALMLQGQKTIDEAKRRAIYQQAAALVHDQVPLVPLVHTSVPIVLKATIAGFRPSPDLRYHFETMSLAK